MTDDLYVFLEQTFEWDRMEAARNAIKHGIRFPEAATVFFDENAKFDSDPDHSIDEERLIVLGFSIRSNVLLVVHALRGERIRILSARTATAGERRRYEEAESTA